MKGVNPNLNIDIHHYYDSTGLVYHDRFIMSLEYPEYRNEQALSYKKINKKYYLTHWHEGSIYLKNEGAK